MSSKELERLYVINYLIGLIILNFDDIIRLLKNFNADAIYFNFPIQRRNLRNTEEAFLDLFNSINEPDYYKRLERNDKFFSDDGSNEKIDIAKKHDINSDLLKRLGNIYSKGNYYVHPSVSADVLHKVIGLHEQNQEQEIIERGNKNLVYLVKDYAYIFSECLKVLIKQYGSPLDDRSISTSEIEKAYNSFANIISSYSSTAIIKNH